MRKYILIAMLAIMTLFISAPAQAQTQCNNTTLGTVCAIVDGTSLRVTLLGNTIITMTLPTTVVKVPVPGPTVTVKVPVPGPTITLPRTTVTLPGTTVTLPGSTVTQPSKTSPGATVTVTSPGQNGKRSVTITSAPPATHGGESTNAPQEAPAKVVKVTVPKAIGISLGLLILGALLVLAAMLLYYYLGYKERENNEKKFIRSLIDDLHRK